MKMKSALGVYAILGGIIRTGSGILAIVFAFIGFQMHFVDRHERFEKFNKLRTEGVATQAQSNNDVKQTKYKIKGVEVEYYEFSYQFQANGTTYKGKASVDHVDSVKSTFRIYYLPESPDINAANVEQELEEAKAKLDSNVMLWMSIAALLVGFVLIILGIRKFRINLRELKKSPK